MALILPVRDRWHYTQAILNALQQQISAANLGGIYQIIVADDGSSDGTPESIQAQFPQVILIQGTGDWWWTGAIAAGMDYALTQTEAKTLVWLNDDLELAPDFIQQLRAICAEPQYQQAIVGGIVRDRTRPDWIMFSGLANGQPIRQISQFLTPYLPAETLNGNMVVIPRPIAEQLGLPDVRRFPHYGGDYEYTERARRSGIPLYLSQSLQAQADYTAADVVRYMPVWMQWRLTSSWAARWQILQNLWSLKFHHNVWHIVNRMYIEQSQVPRWRYWVFYIKKVMQCLNSLKFSRPRLHSQFQRYFEQNQIPPHLRHQIEPHL
ncbi:MAG: glycosyltransferase family 2 protein [Spirulina sp. SIO3F2]|nr:glycosyltransferase family 2 protein [Spirulina sp. SIO3F2]